jgi:hypothetical protein
MRTRSCNKFDLCNHLELNEGAYFYKKEAFVIDENKIEEVILLWGNYHVKKRPQI